MSWFGSPWVKKECCSLFRNSLGAVVFSEIGHTASCGRISRRAPVCTSHTRSCWGWIFRGKSCNRFRSRDTMVEMSIQELLVSDLLPVVSPWPEPFLLDSKGDWHSSLDLSSPGGMHLLPLPEGLISSWRIMAVDSLASIGPIVTWIFWNILGLSIQFDWSFIILDSRSAIIFSLPGRYWADRRMFFSRHHIQRSLTGVVTWRGTIPPILLMYATAVILSKCNKTCLFVWCLRNVFTASVAASISRQFMYHDLSDGDHGPLSWDPRKSLPTLSGKHLILLLHPVSSVEGTSHSIWLDGVSTSRGLPSPPLKVDKEHCSIGCPSLAPLLGLSGDVCKKEVLVEQLVTLHSSSLAPSRYPEQNEVALKFPICWPPPSVSWFFDLGGGAPVRGCVSPYPGILSLVLELWVAFPGWTMKPRFSRRKISVEVKDFLRRLRCSLTPQMAL